MSASTNDHGRILFVVLLSNYYLRNHSRAAITTMLVWHGLWLFTVLSTIRNIGFDNLESRAIYVPLLEFISLFGIILTLFPLADRYRPEQRGLMELQGAQPTPLTHIIRGQVVASWALVTLSFIVNLLLTLLILRAPLGVVFVSSVIGAIVVTTLTTGVVMLAATVGRSSRIAYIAGFVLIGAAFSFAFRGQPIHEDFYTLNADDLTRFSWWLPRLLLIGAGLVCGAAALRLARSTEYLIIGPQFGGGHKPTSRQSVTRQHKLRFDRRLTAKLSQPLALPESRWLPVSLRGRIAYNALVEMLDGFLPLAALAFAVFLFIPLFDSVRYGDFSTYFLDVLEIIKIGGLALTVILPLIVIDAVPRDHQQGLAEQTLALISPRVPGRENERSDHRRIGINDDPRCGFDRHQPGRSIVHSFGLSRGKRLCRRRPCAAGIDPGLCLHHRPVHTDRRAVAQRQRDAAAARSLDRRRTAVFQRDLQRPHGSVNWYGCGKRPLSHRSPGL
jgi:ABC-type transport system involved in cytochrome c biogenesis permease component